MCRDVLFEGKPGLLGLYPRLVYGVIRTDM
jgi:hypothetical protein